MSNFYSLCIGSSMYSHNQRHRKNFNLTYSSTIVFEHNIHNIWKVKAAAAVKRYEMDVEVGRYVCWDGTPSIKRLDSQSNPKLFPDELVPSSAEYWLSNSWNSRSHVISLHILICKKIYEFYMYGKHMQHIYKYMFWKVKKQAEHNIRVVIFHACMNSAHLVPLKNNPKLAPFDGVDASDVHICRKQVFCACVHVYDCMSEFVAYMSACWSAFVAAVSDHFYVLLCKCLRSGWQY